MEQMTPGYPQLHWHGPLPVFPMPTAVDLAKRIERTLARLKRANGEYALQLEGDIADLRRMLDKVLALTAGVATCGHCEQPVAEGESTHAVCRRTEGE